MANTMNRQPNADWFIKEIKFTSVTCAARDVVALPTTTLTNRREIWVQNSTGADAWIGDINIHAGQHGGWRLANGDVQKLKLDAGITLYGTMVVANWLDIIEFA